MSQYNFNFEINSEEFLKGRTLIDLPFNVWEVFGVKGVVAANVVINENEFNLNLVPRGMGNYAFFLTSEIKKKLKIKKGMVLKISLSTIKDKNKDEDDIESNEKDYKKIDKISYVVQPTPLMCGQACVAMLADVTIENVAKTMGTRGSTSIGQIIHALDYYKIRHREKM